MIELHSCNYHCEKPACIKAQRDEMRDALFDQHTVAALRQKLAAQSEPVAWYDLDQMTVYTPVKPTIPGTWTPLYAAPQRTFDDGLEDAALLREDAERYRWFRSKRLWDADSFPWPVGFEYPEPCLWDDGEMLDAAIDAARKV